MQLNRNRLNEAFREAAAYEFRDIPADESQIALEFSPSFEKRMDKLIASEKKKTWKLVNTSAKRAVLIVAVLTMLLAAAFSVAAIREPIVNFFTELHETFMSYTFGGDISKAITTKYQITELPEGFTQSDEYDDTARYVVTYTNQTGQALEFSQSITDSHGVFVDREHSEQSVITVSGKEIHLYVWPGTTMAMWIEDTYLMQIIYQGTIDEAQLTEIISSVKPAD